MLYRIICTTYKLCLYMLFLTCMDIRTCILYMYTSTSGRLHSEFVRLLFLQDHRETDRFFASSGVQFAKHDRGLFHFHRSVFSSQIKKRVALALVKTETLRFMLNIDGVPITSKSHTHPSHSQTSCPLTSSLSLGVPVPRATQCLRDTQIPQL